MVEGYTDANFHRSSHICMRVLVCTVCMVGEIVKTLHLKSHDFYCWILIIQEFDLLYPFIILLGAKLEKYQLKHSLDLIYFIWYFPSSVFLKNPQCWRWKRQMSREIRKGQQIYLYSLYTQSTHRHTHPYKDWKVEKKKTWYVS